MVVKGRRTQRDGLQPFCLGDILGDFLLDLRWWVHFLLVLFEGLFSHSSESDELDRYRPRWSLRGGATVEVTTPPSMTTTTSAKMTTEETSAE